MVAGLLAGITWFALVLQLVLLLNPAVPTGFSTLKSIINFFSYFTILSNLLVAVCLTVILIIPSSPAGRFFSRASVQSAITVYIFIVGLVYNLVLRNLWKPEGWQLVADNLLHVAVPLLFSLYWFFFIPSRSLQWKQLLPWLLFPALYLAYSLLRGEYTHWYPYPFLHAGNLGYGKVVINAIAVLVAFVVTGAGIIGINRMSKEKTSEKS
jgi:hypothetical protein